MTAADDQYIDSLHDALPDALHALREKGSPRLNDTYYIFKCPECGGLQVDTDPESPLAICIHGQGRGKPQRVVERERIEVIPKRYHDQLQEEIDYLVNGDPEEG